MTEKNILCFGDSNTWGYVAESKDGAYIIRHGSDVRWPCVMQRELGSGWRVVEEGLCGRTTAFDDPVCEGRNGLEALRFLMRQKPLPDMVVIALGINDLKPAVCGDVQKSAEALEQILDFLRTEDVGSPGVLVILPARIGPGIFSPPFELEFGRPTIVEESEQLSEAYAEVARRHNISFIDAGQFAVAGTDGLHMDADSHVRLGEAAAEAVLSLTDE